MSNYDYVKEFKARVATLDDYNANILELASCLLEEGIKGKYNKNVHDANKTELKAATENVRKKTLAAFLLIAADCGWYSEMKNCFKQNMAMGTNNYPTSIDETMKVLKTFATTSKGTKARKINYKTEGTC